MRNILAQLIVALARAITLGMKRHRREDTFRRIWEKLGICLPVSVRGKSIRFVGNPCQTGIIRHCLDTEPDTLDWLDQLPSDALLWDIGGNVGLFSLYAALSLKGDRVCVVAFEPAAANYGVLNQNIAANGLLNDQVIAFCVALAGQTKWGSLNLGSAMGTAAGSALNCFDTDVSVHDRRMDTKFRQGSIGFAIDDFVEMFEPPLPTHVKMDVDGIEAEILRGGSQTLSADSVRSMIIEMEGDLTSIRNVEIFERMDELGFTPRSKASPEYRNVIFDRTPDAWIPAIPSRIS